MYAIVKDWGDSILLVATADSEIRASEIAAEVHGYVVTLPYNPTKEQIELARHPWVISLYRNGTVRKCERQEQILDNESFYSKFCGVEFDGDVTVAKVIVPHSDRNEAIGIAVAMLIGWLETNKWPEKDPREKWREQVANWAKDDDIAITRNEFIQIMKDFTE